MKFLCGYKGCMSRGCDTWDALIDHLIEFHRVKRIGTVLMPGHLAPGVGEQLAQRHQYTAHRGTGYGTGTSTGTRK